MLKIKSYIVMYASDMSFMCQDFDTFEDAVTFVLAGNTYTSEWVITKRIDIKITEHEGT